jgi:tetratricopeptide (TPR) repeat protein
MTAPRHRIRCLVLLLLTVAVPAWGRDDAWMEVSRAGVRATEEGRFPEAEQLFRDALRLSEQSPEDAVRRATSLNNLAFTLHALGHYDAAERNYREALTIREAALGKDHADVGQSCNNLAELYRVLGRYAEAEPLHQRARAIRARQFGPEHPEVAQTLNNLGVLYASQGRYEEAEPLYQRRSRFA